MMEMEKNVLDLTTKGYRSHFCVACNITGRLVFRAPTGS